MIPMGASSIRSVPIVMSAKSQPAIRNKSDGTRRCGLNPASPGKSTWAVEGLCQRFGATLIGELLYRRMPARGQNGAG
jgi:hypothetical protein